jgi:hypothetical protein
VYRRIAISPCFVLRADGTIFESWTLNQSPQLKLWMTFCSSGRQQTSRSLTNNPEQSYGSRLEDSGKKTMPSEPTPVPGLPDPSDPKSGDIKIDRENAFLLYATFAGDLVRTGAALGVPPTTVLKMADEEHWNDQLRPILELKKSNRPGDVERAINRALNFVQARRMLMFLERVIHKLTGFTPEELEAYLLSDHSAKDGTQFRKLTTRALADLASALEKCQSLSYSALNDTAQERVKRNESVSDGASASDMHLAISKAFAEVRSSHSPRATLFDAQLSVAQEVIAENTLPANPLDNEDH